MEATVKVKLLSEVIEKQTTEEKQAAITALGKLPYTATKDVFDALIAKMETKNIQTDVLLELSEAVENTNDSGLKERYARSETAFWGGNQLASYQSSLGGGDPVRNHCFCNHRQDNVSVAMPLMIWGEMWVLIWTV